MHRCNRNYGKDDTAFYNNWARPALRNASVCCACLSVLCVRLLLPPVPTRLSLSLCCLSVCLSVRLSGDCLACWCIECSRAAIKCWFVCWLKKWELACGRSWNCIALLYACNDNFISEKKEKSKTQNAKCKQKQKAFEKRTDAADRFLSDSSTSLL